MNRIVSAAILLSTLCIVVLGRPAFGLAQSAEQTSAAPRWTVDRMMTVRNVDNVQMSPDGRRVLFAITRAVMTDDRSEYVSQLHVANADGSNERQLTFGDHSIAGAGEPRECCAAAAHAAADRTRAVARN